MRAAISVAVTRLELYRLSTGDDDTLGALYQWARGARRFLCWTLEDERRRDKVPGETRIPAGTYDLSLRNEGGQTLRYAERFGDFHRGMIHLRDVPGFEFVHIHVGNDDDDTDGCILVGDGVHQNVTEPGRLVGSTAAYKRIYPAIAARLEAGEKVTLAVIDFG